MQLVNWSRRLKKRGSTRTSLCLVAHLILKQARFWPFLAALKIKQSLRDTLRKQQSLAAVFKINRFNCGISFCGRGSTLPMNVVEWIRTLRSTYKGLNIVTWLDRGLPAVTSAITFPFFTSNLCSDLSSPFLGRKAGKTAAVKASVCSVV